MTHGVDPLGPVDWVVVEFPGNRFNGEIAPAVADLVDRGVVRVLDLVMVRKDDDGSVEALRLRDANSLSDSGLWSTRQSGARVGYRFTHCPWLTIVSRIMTFLSRPPVTRPRTAQSPTGAPSCVG